MNGSLFLWLDATADNPSTSSFPPKGTTRHYTPSQMSTRDNFRVYGPGESRLHEKDVDFSTEQTFCRHACAVCFTGVSIQVIDGKVIPNFLKCCSICHLVWYCSQECQRKHWKGGHKKVCRPELKIHKSAERKQAKKQAKAAAEVRHTMMLEEGITPILPRACPSPPEELEEVD